MRRNETRDFGLVGDVSGGKVRDSDATHDTKTFADVEAPRDVFLRDILDSVHSSVVVAYRGLKREEGPNDAEESHEGNYSRNPCCDSTCELNLARTIVVGRRHEECGAECWKVG